MFSEVKKKVQDRFNQMAGYRLFRVEPDREMIWQAYLSGFSPETMQEHNCNSCKSFIRQWGGIVGIEKDKMISIWDIEEVPAEFEQSIKNLSSYIHSLPIVSIFLTPFSKLGTDFNTESVDKIVSDQRIQGTIVWEHFFVTADEYHLSQESDKLMGESVDSKNVFQRALKEISIETTDIVLDLIAQNSLYRGREFAPLLEKFREMQILYKDAVNQELFCWDFSAINNDALNKIRNSAIGSLLVSLSEGKDLDFAVSAFEKIVAPQNYKRTTALVSPRMIEEAQKRIVELGLTSALHRRYAVATDVSVEDILFVDRSSQVADVFATMKKELKVNPRTLSKVDEISIEDFIKNVLPTSKSLHVLLENKHLNNFVSLIAPIENDVNRLFKWNNNFSWSYTNGVTDSIKERVKQAGGRVEGELRVSLSWHNFDDLDLHIQEPTHGPRIYHGAKISTRTGGTLDVDMNAHVGTTREPVENVIWPDKSRMVEGVYTVMVNNYAMRERADSGYTVEIEHDGQIYTFSGDRNPNTKDTDTICTILYNKATGIEFTTTKPNGESAVISKQKWGVSTNQFTKVKMVSLSPNHWDGAIGNKHFIFVLENCISDEAPRPFFNEFLTENLMQDRKVFEVLGSKIKVEPSADQLSGVGFSDTVKDHLFVKVEGNFSRTLKVII